jgi:hypothetical protein
MPESTNAVSTRRDEYPGLFQPHGVHLLFSQPCTDVAYNLSTYKIAPSTAFGTCSDKAGITAVLIVIADALCASPRDRPTQTQELTSCKLRSGFVCS